MLPLLRSGVPLQLTRHTSTVGTTSGSSASTRSSVTRPARRLTVRLPYSRVIPGRSTVRISFGSGKGKLKKIP